MGKMINFQRPDGQAVAGYLAWPAQGAVAPGIVVKRPNSPGAGRWTSSSSILNECGIQLPGEGQP